MGKGQPKPRDTARRAKKSDACYAILPNDSEHLVQVRDLKLKTTFFLAHEAKRERERGRERAGAATLQQFLSLFSPRNR